jgi:hypothetical protein
MSEDQQPQNETPVSSKKGKKRGRPSRAASAPDKKGLSKTQKIVGGLALAALVAGGVVACFSIFGSKDGQPE